MASSDRGADACLGVASCALLSFLLYAPASAQTVEALSDHSPGLPSPSIAANFPRAFADPGAMRSALADRGIAYKVRYIGEAAGNPVGGFAQGATYLGLLDVEVEADLEKSIGWKGLKLFANGYQIHGESISARDLGVLMPVSHIEALPSTRLFELYLEQSLLDGGLSLRVGQLAADSEFAVSESGAAFLNGSFGWPSILGVNLPDGGPSYPLATPAARLAFKPNDAMTYLFGIFNAEPAGHCPNDKLPEECNPHGLLFPITSPLLLAETAYRYNQGEGELAGTLKLGTWRNFGTFVPENIGSGGLPIGLTRIPGLPADKNYGFYAILDQMIYRVPGPGDPRGITLFGTYMGAPPEGNLIQHYFEAGITMHGLLSERPNDILGVGFIYAGVSSQIIDFYRESGYPVVPSFEGVLEVSYTAELMQGLHVQPDFQYFWNPGGRTGNPDDPSVPIPNAAVFSLRTTINY
ncbi:MAG TPA: carbohydrate porin [Hyphomicrobium sp.]|nr:carbohydrate porin [Hyphomicrobium sp.]